MKLFYLVLYAIVTCFITVRSIIKKKGFMYCSIWTVYAVSAVFCVLCKVFHQTLVGNGIMQAKWYDLSDTTWWGYALIIICNLIAFRPFNAFDKRANVLELGEGRAKKQFFWLIAVGYIILSLAFILMSLGTVRSLLRISDYGLIRTTLYSNSENEGGFVMTSNFIANLFYKLCIQFKYLNVFICLMMIKDKYRVKTAVLSLMVTFFVYYLYAVGNAARGGLLIFVFCCGVIGMCLYKYMPRSSQRKILIYGGIAVAVVISFFMAVTISRFGNDGGGGNPILRNISFYLGHGPIEFSKVTGSIEDFAYGKTIVGRLISHYFNTPYSWAQIQADIGYPSIGPVFITYLGYLYIDFGIISCLVFVSLWSSLMNSLLKKSPNRISTFCLFCYYLSYFVTGNFVVGRLEYAAMITAHVIWLLIRLIEDFLRQRNRAPRYVYSSGTYRRM